MRLPANCAHPERRASEIRLAIARVCQAAAGETTILTEQTEFTDRCLAPPTIAEQIFLRWDFSATRLPDKGAQRPPHCAGPLKIVAKGMRLRCVVFKLLFYSPRIAPNTGNAIRTAAATGAELHLVEPLGFDLSEPKLRRAGLDYHDLASVTVHASLDDAWKVLSPQRVF